MPFDGLVKSKTFTKDVGSINAVLASLGIEPVSKDVLTKHKAQELARHPPSLFYRRPHLFPVFTFLCFVSVIMSFVLALSLVDQTLASVRLSLLGVMVVSAAMLMKLVLSTRIVEPAQWVETRPMYFENTKMPDALMQLARQIKDAAPSVKFVVGTLYQNSFPLDPYLMVEKYDFSTGNMTTSACLGIWDGKTIIHIAKQHT